MLNSMRIVFCSDLQIIKGSVQVRRLAAQVILVWITVMTRQFCKLKTTKAKEAAVHMTFYCRGSCTHLIHFPKKKTIVYDFI